MVRMNAARNITIQGNGGHIDQLIIMAAQNIHVDHLNTTKFNSRWMYDFAYTNLHGHTDGPTAYDLMWGWHGNIQNIDASGARSQTDNGNFKIMSLSDTTISGVQSYDSIASAQGTYPFMADFDYVPYNMWSVNLTISDVHTRDTHWASGTPFGIFLGGLRDSHISNMTTTDSVTLRSNVGLTVDGLQADGQLQFRSGKNYDFRNFRGDVISMGDDGAVADSHFDHFNLTGKSASYASRSLWIRSRSTGLVFTNGTFAPSANTSIYVNNGCQAEFDTVNDAGGQSIYNDNANVTVKRSALRGAMKGAAVRRMP